MTRPSDAPATSLLENVVRAQSRYFKWAALIVFCYSVPLVFGSVQHWLDKFNGVLLPFYLLGLLAAVGLDTTAVETA